MVYDIESVLPLGDYDMSSMSMSGMVEELGQHEWRITTHTRKVVSFEGRHPRGNTFVFTRAKKSQESAKSKVNDQVPGYVALQKYPSDDERCPSDGSVTGFEHQTSTDRPKNPSGLDDGTPSVFRPESESGTSDGIVINEIGVVRHERNKEVWVSLRSWAYDCWSGP